MGGILYNNNDNALRFFKSGFTEAMRIDSTGNVLINTTSSTYSTSGRGVLEIDGSTGASAGSLLGLKVNGTHGGYIYANDSMMQLYYHLNKPMAFYTNATERMRITSSGNVGIGTTAPSRTLSIASPSGPNFELKRTGFAGYTYIEDDGTNSIYRSKGETRFQTGGNNERLRIDSNGNCRIASYNGTGSSPSESADWPTPALAIRTYDGYYKNSVMSFGYAGDSEYQTGNNVWNLRLWDTNNTYNVSTSSSLTDLELLGPGNLLLGAGTGPKVRITTAGVLELGVGNNTAIIRNTKAGDDIVIDNSVNGGIRYQADNNGHTFKVYDGAWKDALVVTDSGPVTMPYQPAFHAFRTTGNFSFNTGYFKIPLNSASGTGHNIGNHFNTSTSRFTAPVSGVYNLAASVNYYGVSSGYLMWATLWKNGSSTGGLFGTRFYSGGTGDINATVVGDLYLSAGDYIETYGYTNDPSGGGSGSTSGHWNYFTGHLVG